MSMTPIQRNFQAVMDEKGLNMRSWALKAGLKDTRVKAVMQGKSKNPRADTLAALARAAGVPVTRLLGTIPTKIDPKVAGDLSHEIEDQEFFRLWSEVDPDIKIGFLMLMRAITRAAGGK
jgi:transcriptional regulator with XRE-family HTH domain